ncbi:D-alanyl-D-alanine carboxypeptidase family protein [Actinomadura sediminis]|uniref:Peptidase S11 D-alanyl-D-alanine carboxypeptidase A N-terminal domain-containing protein n=1 Tax=Actinomadura sediminis TaxID=1038904 RepID=A0ABW3EQZ7_9ACTN
MTETPDAPETAEPADRAPARTPTAEFRVPDVTETRDDIAVRRPEAATTRAERLPAPPEDGDTKAPDDPAAGDDGDDGASAADEPSEDDDRPDASEARDDAPPADDTPAAETSDHGETDARTSDGRAAPHAPSEPEPGTPVPGGGTPPASDAPASQREDTREVPDDHGDEANAQRQAAPGNPARPASAPSEDDAATEHQGTRQTQSKPRESTPDTSEPHGETPPGDDRPGGTAADARHQAPSRRTDEPGPQNAGPGRAEPTPHESGESTPDASGSHGETPPGDDRPGGDAADGRQQQRPRRPSAPRGPANMPAPQAPSDPERRGPRGDAAGAWQQAPRRPDEAEADQRATGTGGRTTNDPGHGGPDTATPPAPKPPAHDRPGGDRAGTWRQAPPRRPDEGERHASRTGGRTASDAPGNATAAQHQAPPQAPSDPQHSGPDTATPRTPKPPAHDRPGGDRAGTWRQAPPRRPDEGERHAPGESGERAADAAAPHGEASARGRPGEGAVGVREPGVPEAGRTFVDVPAPVASPPYRGDVHDGEGGLVRFVGFEPVGDATRQDVPRIAEAPEGPEDERAGRRVWPWALVAVLVVVMAVVTAQLVRPVPAPELRLTIAAEHTFPGAAPQLPWPGSGQSAVFVEGLGMMGTSGDAVPAPTASVAKVMTAYVYLRDHPLRPGEPGPTLAVSPEGVAEMPMRRQRGESLLGITQGQRLTQRKALEALMIISANDVAHELAKWDSGSVQAFVAKMNAAARELGMTNTTYTDPSGYDAGTVSTAADQVKLLRAAMDVPAFAEIVNQRTYVPANGGPVRQGGNFLLGQFGVVGGKTGFTDAAGGNFVFAARKDVAGVPTLIVGAVMGQRTASAAGAVSAAGGLVQAAEGALTAATLAQAGARVAVVDDGLGGTTPVRAAAAVTVVGWPGLTVDVAAQGDPPAEAAAGEETGTLTAGAAEVPLRFGDAYDGPSLVDRLTRLE